jgi:FtsH-binding integral membrane protein
VSTISPASSETAALGRDAVARDRSRALLGQVMGLVAITVGCTAAGAYLGRDLSAGVGLGIFLGAFACVIVLNIAVARGNVQVAVMSLFALGLTLGLGIAPVIADYAARDPAALWQAAGTTALFVGACGAYGYATRRDLSSWERSLFWLLLVLIVFGILGIFVAIPSGNIVYSAAGLGIFGAYTILDFNRIRRSEADGAVVIAAGIFLDVFNIFLLALDLFGDTRS